jgi:DNA-binding transcriptional ArsR family regulator
LKTRPSRAYADEAIRAGSHPTRRTILKTLQEGDCTTSQLEQITGENRYNLYHHLAILKEAGLVDARLEEGRVRKYHLSRSERPQAVFFQVSREENGRSRRWDSFMQALQALVSEEVPHMGQVDQIAVMLSYPWTEKE